MAGRSTATSIDSRPSYLVGTAGFPNFGDEYITAAWLDFLASVAPDREVWLDCPNPGLADHLFGFIHPRLRVTNTLWRAVSDSAGLPGREAGKRVRHLVLHQGSPAYDLGLQQLAQVQSVHLLGGGYLNAEWGHHLGLLDGMRAAKELCGAHLYATGQGLIPIPLDRGDPAAFFAEFDYASARDVQSVTATGIRAGIDDAFLAPLPEPPPSGDPIEAALMVCIQSDMADAMRFTTALATARAAVEAAVLQGRPVFYLEAIPGMDRHAYDALADLIPAAHFLPFAHLWQHGLPVGPEQQWITSRFHFHLLAAAAGAPGIAVVMKEGYYDVKHGSLLSLGSGWAYDDGTSPAIMPSASGALRPQLPALAHLKLEEARMLYPTEPARRRTRTRGRD